MNWVLVNYTVIGKNETFDVSEQEEKNRKKTKPLKYILKKLYPLFLLIINQIQMPKKQSDKFKIWRAYVKYMLDRNQGKKSLKYLLKNYSKKEYAEFKKKPMRFI